MIIQAGLAQTASTIRELRKAGDPERLGLAYYQAGQHLLFRDQMAEAIRLNPSAVMPYYYLARHYQADVGNYQEAIEWFLKALRQNPDFAPAHAYLGVCLEHLGRPAEAEKQYRAAPNHPESQLGLARLRLEAGDANSALDFVQASLRSLPANAAGQKLAARIFTALNRPRDALQALESAAAATPWDAAIQYQIYRLSQSLEEKEKARHALAEFEKLRAVYGIQPR